MAQTLTDQGAVRMHEANTLPSQEQALQGLGGKTSGVSDAAQSDASIALANLRSSSGSSFHEAPANPEKAASNLVVAGQKKMAKTPFSMHQTGHPLQSVSQNTDGAASSASIVKVMQRTLPGTYVSAEVNDRGRSNDAGFPGKGQPAPDRIAMAPENRHFGTAAAPRTGLIQTATAPQSDTSRATATTAAQTDFVTETEFSPDLALDQQRAGTVTSSSTPMRTEIHHHVARQLAEAMFQNGNKPVELTLSPEELGRVRLSIKSAEHGIVVSVLAERTETLDLMRRHIDELRQEFQDLGYRDITFSFGESSHPETGTDADNPEERAWADTPGTGVIDQADTETIHLSTGPLSGLDLRL